jgi:hypothetical protein
LRLNLSFILTFLGDFAELTGRETAAFLEFLEPEALLEECFARDDFLAVTLAVTECRVVVRWGCAGDFFAIVGLAFPSGLAEAGDLNRIASVRAGAFFAFRRTAGRMAPQLFLEAFECGLVRIPAGKE